MTQNNDRSPSVSCIVLFVLVFSFAWIPFKVGLFFDLEKFDNATHADNEPGQEQNRSAAWVAIAAITFAGLLPLVESVLYKLTVYNCRMYLLESTAGSNVGYQRGNRPVIASSVTSSSSSSETEPLLLRRSALSVAAEKKRDEMAAEEKQLKTMSVRSAFRKAGWFGRVFATYQFGLLRQGYRAPLSPDYVWHLPDALAPSTLHGHFTKHAKTKAVGSSNSSRESPSPASPSQGSSTSIGWVLYSVVKSDLWSAVGWAAVQAGSMLAAPLLLKEMSTWIGAPCYEYNPVYVNLTQGGRLEKIKVEVRIRTLNNGVMEHHNSVLSLSRGFTLRSNLC